MEQCHGAVPKNFLTLRCAFLDLGRPVCWTRHLRRHLLSALVFLNLETSGEALLYSFQFTSVFVWEPRSVLVPLQRAFRAWRMRVTLKGFWPSAANPMHHRHKSEDTEEQVRHGGAGETRGSR